MFYTPPPVPATVMYSNPSIKEPTLPVLKNKVVRFALLSILANYPSPGTVDSDQPVVFSDMWYAHFPKQLKSLSRCVSRRAILHDPATYQELLLSHQPHHPQSKSLPGRRELLPMHHPSVLPFLLGLYWATSAAHMDSSFVSPPSHAASRRALSKKIVSSSWMDEH